ncbi:MAG: SDR family oxidoreductase [Betaproteobacteria bacterium]|nr:SDR family oxidoreductase [Betaproteobacteria bacterium]
MDLLKYFPVRKEDFSGPVLVTGAGGCIGSWALTILTRAHVPVAAMDLSVDTRRPALLLSEQELKGIPWHTGDIGDYGAVLATVEKVRPCAIVHLAALQVPFCKADPIAGAIVNVVGTVNVFETARKLGIKRIAYASSIAAHGAMEGHGTLPTLYGAYKHCNEQTAIVYAQDWGVGSVGLRPGVVYGVGRDQGLTSKTTVAVLAAAANRPYTVPFRGPVSWLHAGEVASAFIRAVSKDLTGAPVFDINGVATTVEDSMAIVRAIAPQANISVSGEALPFPMSLSDEPVRKHLGNYGSVPLPEGIASTYRAFQALIARGSLSSSNVN